MVKAIVPGLEVETMTCRRIGERRAARLVAWDRPLKCHGAALALELQGPP